MKQLLLSLLFACSLGMLFSSCSTGSSDDVATLQRKVDSLTKLVPASRGGAMTSNLAANSQFSVAPTAASYWYVSDAANKQIQEWHTVLKNGGRIDWDKNKGRTAFMVPAITLDTLINSLGCQYVVFYIGIDQQGTKEMSLFYTGVQQTDPNTLSEIEMRNNVGEKCVFDFSYPCPKCDKIGIHVGSAGIGGQPAPSVFSFVVDDGGMHGSISPDGQKVYYNTTTATYTFHPDKDYVVDSVIANNVPVQTDGVSYTFENLSGSNEIKVKYKHK